jgi:Protein of unknown function (DUF3775)
MPDIAPAKLAFIIVKAREYDAKVDAEEQDPASNAADDCDVEVLEDFDDDTTEEELADAIASLNEDELDELVAMMWIGRGDFDRSQWAEAVRQAAESRNAQTAEYLMGTPLLGDYVAEGAAELGISLEDEFARHL